MMNMKTNPRIGRRGRDQRRMQEYLVSFYEKNVYDLDVMYSRALLIKSFAKSHKHYPVRACRECLRNDRKVTSFQRNDRNRFYRATPGLLASEEYRDYKKNDGVDHVKRFDFLETLAMKKMRIFPSISENVATPGSPSRHWRALRHDDFVILRNRRSNAIVKEIQRIVPIYEMLTREFPSLRRGITPRALPSGDGLFLVKCPECESTFKGEHEFAMHYRDEHGWSA